MNRIFLLFLLLAFCKQHSLQTESNDYLIEVNNTTSFGFKLSNAAISIIDSSIKYAPDYVSIPYPNGDVPSHTGVCTDVVIRAYRKLDIDLQELVHEDMKQHFNLYPKIWGLCKPDTNINHRRVPNLEVFFSRFVKELEISNNPDEYKPGDIVTWLINNKLPHIGIVTHLKSDDKKRPMIVHNIGGGQVIEDCLFEFEKKNILNSKNN